MREGGDPVDVATLDIQEAVEGADLVVLAMPVDVMADCVCQINAFAADALVTDVGSVKRMVVDEIEPLVTKRGGRFLGGHPMAGSDQAGLKHADPGLFVDAAVILTPGPSASPRDVERLTLFWQSLGAKVSSLSADVHDEIVAGISHLPHLVAAALVRTVLGKGPEAGKYSGGGFRDTTRVARGPETMWAGILAGNASAISNQLEELIRELENWKQALDALDREGLQRFLSDARGLRDAL